MSDFFARQEDARRRTTRLLIFFAVAVLAVALAVYLVAVCAYILSVKSTAGAGIWYPRLFLWTTGGTLLFVGFGSFWKIQQLSAGGSRVATMLGGRWVPFNTSEPRERQLRNVVEEMAIASGVPVPDLYLLDQERGINAFAAGHDLNDAVICVTRGAVELLDRNELQGVVAHEFGHILNGDMRLNLRLMGWLNGILMVGELGEMGLRGVRRTGGKGSGPIALIAVALYGIGYIGYFFGRLIKCAVSRQREYLGDASAAQFTRNPEGLAGALKKIGGLITGSRIDHPRAPEICHLFFSNALPESWLHALDSHPPLADRIRRLDPFFDGTFPEVTPLPAPPPLERYCKPQPVKAAPEPITVLSGAAVAALLEQIGDPLQEHIDRARRLISELPEALSGATHDPFGACAVVYGLLLDRDPKIRAVQEGILASLGNKALITEVSTLSPDVAGLPPEARLPVLDLSLPALRTLSREQYLVLKETVGKLTAADKKISLFEFTLRHLLLRHLEPHFEERSERPAQVYGLRGVQEECSCILTVMARVGHRDETLARQAFEQGLTVLREGKARGSLLPAAEFSFLPTEDCGVACLERAFSALERTSPRIKRRLLAACLECLVHDGTVTVAEIELFRAIADAIGCPLPPWLDSSQANSAKSLTEQPC
ncbi:MAG TPA: M48 family metallopeptidase [Geobacteraceae bacterium]|nr:M48 family metallopeptidase [Geobacteraceae bacterium]